MFLLACQAANRIQLLVKLKVEMTLCRPLSGHNCPLTETPGSGMCTIRNIVLCGVNQ